MHNSNNRLPFNRRSLAKEVCVEMDLQDSYYVVKISKKHPMKTNPERMKNTPSFSRTNIYLGFYFKNAETPNAGGCPYCSYQVQNTHSLAHATVASI